jgi:hypothetical protein
VLVRPNGDIGLHLPGPSGELHSIARLDFGRPDPLNEILGSFQTQYFDGLAHVNPAPQPLRFSAFADAHFDSLENPAYATEFNRAEGRLFLLPSFSRARSLLLLSNPALVPGIHAFDNTLATQLSLFAPLKDSGVVLGGSVTVARTELQGVAAADLPFQSSPTLTAEHNASVLTTTTVTLLAARRFNAGRTSAGVKFDYLAGRGAVTSEETQTRQGQTGIFRVDARAVLDHTRLTAGLTHTLDEGKKLGLFLRVGSLPATYLQRQQASGAQGHGLIDYQRAEERHAGRTAELGLRWRAPLTRQFFYGAESLLTHERWRAATSVRNPQSGAVVSGNEQGRTTRALLGGSLSYAPQRRTLLNVDLTLGLYRERSADDVQQQRAHFLALHAAGQTELWRGAFVSSSFLKTTQWETREAFAPGRPPFRFTAPVRTHYFASHGAGWRWGAHWLAQYLVSTSYGSTPLSHSVVLRYNFGLTRER